MFNATITYNSTIGFNVSELDDYTASVFLWDTPSRIVFATFLMSLLIVECIMRSLMINFIKFYAPSRPINKMMLVDQVCQLVTSSISGGMTLISLFQNNLLIKDFGRAGCMLLGAGRTVNGFGLILGGLGKAVFRFMCIKFPSSIHQSKKRMKNILMMEHLLIFAYESSLWICAFQSDPNTPITFCRGYNSGMRDIIREYDESHGFVQMRYVALALSLILLLAPFAEMCIYVYIFNFLNENDQQIGQKGILPKSDITKRRRKNIITLYGQVIIFGIEIWGIGIAIMVNSALGNIIDESLQTPLAIVFSSASAIAHFLASPELKRFYSPDFPSYLMEFLPSISNSPIVPITTPSQSSSSQMSLPHLNMPNYPCVPEINILDMPSIQSDSNSSISITESERLPRKALDSIGSLRSTTTV